MVMEDYRQYCYPGTRCQEYMFQADKQVRLRVIHFRPAIPSRFPPIVMVVGLATFIESFKGVIGGITRDFEVFYYETREKKSSQLNGKVNFDIETVAHDLATIINRPNLGLDRYILFGYSYGATVIAAAYSQLEAKPGSLILLSPTPSFHYPRWSLPLIRISVPLYPVLKPVAKWYLRNFVINRQQDNEMYMYTSHALDEADPHKLKDAILAIAGYEVYEKLSSIDCRTLIVNTSLDGIHRTEDILRMASNIRDSTYLDMQSNKRTHGPGLADVIRDFLEPATTIEGASAIEEKGMLQ
jgi:pimeloyl-ACP methyl ester carboxylesterase